MRNSFITIIIFLICVGLWSCGEDNDNITGSINYEIKDAFPTIPEILADGISSTVIVASVFNREGQPAQNMKVVFQTTLGTIDAYAMSDHMGQAHATLTSVASRVDLQAQVTAVVVEPDTSSLRKSLTGRYKVILLASNIDASDKSGKLYKSADNKATIDVTFLGVSISATLADSILPADGLSMTSATIRLFETTSKLTIPNAEIRLNAQLGRVSGKSGTNSEGFAEVAIRAAETAGTDTLFISYGATLKEKVALIYVTPTLNLSAEKNMLAADGQSTLPVVATLLTHNNTPITGAKIKFTISNGIVPGTAVTDGYGQATVNVVSGSEPREKVVITAQFLSLKDTLVVSFVDASAGNIAIQSDPLPVPRDGVTEKEISFVVTDKLNHPLKDTPASIRVDRGFAPAMVTTDNSGTASFIYTPDTGDTDATATITISADAFSVNHEELLLGIDMTVSAAADQISADRNSQTVITVSLKYTTSHVPITGRTLFFTTDLGYVPQSTVTNELGIATVPFTGTVTPGEATVTVFCGRYNKKITINLAADVATNMTLSTQRNFIWVKETGKIEQTDITCTVMGHSGQPVDKKHQVKFTIANGPGGGERLDPAGPTARESAVVETVNGAAQVKLLSGIRSGAVQVRAELVDSHVVIAQNTNIIIRSGPPYMWVDPSNPDNLIHYGTVLIEPGKANVAFVNPVQEIGVTAIFADKYNNPVEEGTAVYFTTTGGLVSTDAVTCELGRAQAVLQNSNPFPFLKSVDPNQQTACCLPNPNDESGVINMNIPDFEVQEINNSMGDKGQNDGVAVVLAVTNGQDQFGNAIKVWNYVWVVFSTTLYVFDVSVDKTELSVGEAATFIIRAYDIFGNPVAAGSQLSVTSDAGELSKSSLIPNASKWGYGTTFFTTQLFNNLKPEDDPKYTKVSVKLSSPNGDAERSFSIYLNNNP